MSGGRHAVRPRYSISGWLAFLCAGSVVAVLTTVAVPDLPWLPGLVQAAGIGGAVVGVVRHRPVNGYAWWLMLAGGVGWILADAVVRTGNETGSRIPAWATVALACSYALFALGLALLTRRPGGRLASTVDTLIIGAAVLVAIWAFAVRPMLTTAWPLPPATALALGHAAAAGVLVVSVLRFAALDHRPSTGSALLSAAALILALADVAAAAPVADAVGLSQAGALAGQLWAVVLAAAALHPAAVRLQSAASPTGPAVSSRRLAVFVLLALVAPAAPLGVTIVLDSSGQRGGLTAYIPPTLAAVAVTVLLVIRLGLIARVAEGQARDLRRSLRQRAALERELRHRATHDSLTGLVNRTVLLERLDRTLAAPAGRDGTLAIIDLDGFKDINDTLGHAAGDEVLVQVAQRLRGAVAAADLVVRLGGDEFAVLCAPGIDGRIQARRALDALRPAYRAGPGEVYLSGTAGVVDLAESSTSAEALRDADLALTAAKEIGKNQLVTFHTGLREARVRRGDLAAGLRRALVENRLAVHYQPVVDLSDGRMAAVEALVRWTGDDGTSMSPATFIPIAEETGLIVPIGKYVLRRACSDARVWHERYGIAVTVNVSGYQLREPDFVDEVLAVLAETKLPPKALVLELTESTMITEIEATRALEQLRTHGVRVAIDDFGTGYSSLSYLVRLPVDILKIDRAFTSPPDKPAPHHWAFVRAILDLANSLRLLTIAEGVETDQQAHTLRNLDCPLAQGYLYSRPVPATAIAQLLPAWNTRYAEPPTEVDGAVPVAAPAGTTAGVATGTAAEATAAADGAAAEETADEEPVAAVAVAAVAVADDAVDEATGGGDPAGRPAVGEVQDEAALAAN